MKTLFLLRHAKSSWDDPGLADHERPLNDRGLKAAPFMGKFLRRNNLIPEIIISSPAARARHTAELIRDAGKMSAELILDERVYEATPGALLEVAAELDDAVGNAMLVGHNPGMEGFIRNLTGAIEPMPTAAVAVMDIDIAEWVEVGPGSGKLRAVYRPKELKREA